MKQGEAWPVLPKSRKFLGGDPEEGRRDVSPAGRLGTQSIHRLGFHNKKGSRDSVGVFPKGRGGDYME